MTAFLINTIHTDNFVPQYANGTWHWNSAKEKFEFHPRIQVATAGDEFVQSGVHKFLAHINQLEEMVFRQEFQRPETTHDADVILIQDIKDLVMFLVPGYILNKRFIRFVHTRTVDNLLKALIVYFEYYLKVVEFILIRRDEISANEKAQLQTEESNEMKRIFSAHLSQYRLLIAREYSKILLGDGDMKKYHHIVMVVDQSATIRDRRFHEEFMAFIVQVVWIAMHRRAYDVIVSEIDRLFRSDHFKLPGSPKRIKFTRAEASLINGKNYQRMNYRAQISPLSQELYKVSPENEPILDIGILKYRGTDLRIHQVELEFIVPESQLCLIDVTHGILGHPKRLYNTMLEINWEAVRFQKYTELYDPYHIIRQPALEIPTLDEEKLRKHAHQYESYYKISRHFEPLTKVMFKKWYDRDRILNYFKTKGVLTNVWSKCEHEINDKSYGPSVEEITQKFVAKKEKLRKK